MKERLERSGEFFTQIGRKKNYNNPTLTTSNRLGRHSLHLPSKRIPFFCLSYFFSTHLSRQAHMLVVKRTRPLDPIRRFPRECSMGSRILHERVIRAFHYLDVEISWAVLNIAVYCRGRADDKIRGGWCVMALLLACLLLFWRNEWLYRRAESWVCRLARTDI